MWRYQAKPTSFGTTPWACQTCGDYTCWRVVAADADLVPHSDAPESWGRRGQWLEDIRRPRNEVVDQVAELELDFFDITSFITRKIMWLVAILAVFYYLRDVVSWLYLLQE